MAIGDVTFYPNYIWDSGYSAAAEPSIVTQGYASSGGETSGPAYDLVDGRRTPVITIDTNGEATDFTIDYDLSANIIALNYFIIDNHNLETASANVSIESQGDSVETITAAYSGTLGSATASESVSSNIVVEATDGCLLAVCTAFTEDLIQLEFVDNGGANFTADVTMGEVFIGKSFSPSTAPETNDFIPNYDGIQLARTLGGNKHTTKYFGERKAWSLKWSYMSESDKESMDTVINVTEGHRYPFYIDLGEESTPRLYFVRLVPGSYRARKLTASAYEVSLSIESEV